MYTSLCITLVAFVAQNIKPTIHTFPHLQCQGPLGLPGRPGDPGGKGEPGKLGLPVSSFLYFTICIQSLHKCSCEALSECHWI